jgi:hypothetical protein
MDGEGRKEEKPFCGNDLGHDNTAFVLQVIFQRNCKYEFFPGLLKMHAQLHTMT